MDDEELDYGESPQKLAPLGAAKAAAAAAVPATAATADDVDADEIYGDLFAPAAPPPPTSGTGGSRGGIGSIVLPPGSIAALELAELRRRAASQDDTITRLQAEVGALKVEREKWKAERTTLVTNMSSIFLTAKAELARKDVAVKEARAAADAAVAAGRA